MTQSAAEKRTRTSSDTIVINQKIAGEWRAPPFQRPLRINSKVAALAEAIKGDGGVIPGVITLGKCDGKTYLIDGQHRVQAFLISGHKDGYADVRIHEFDSVGAMGEEFVNLNSRLVTLRPDDILRGLEQNSPALHGIRERCPFVGYDVVRKVGGNAPFLSMSVLMRAWHGSICETPSTRALSTAALAKNLSLFDADQLSTAAAALEKAWGRDPEFYRLWGQLNLTLCLWIYRRMVLDTSKAARHARKDKRGGTQIGIISPANWVKAMMALSTNGAYIDWLVGRQLADRNRSPAYNKISNVIRHRILAETKQAVVFPKPAWAY